MLKRSIILFTFCSSILSFQAFADDITVIVKIHGDGAINVWRDDQSPGFPNYDSAQCKGKNKICRFKVPEGVGFSIEGISNIQKAYLADS